MVTTFKCLVSIGVLFWIMAWPEIATSTTIIVVRNPTEIVVGIDSRLTVIQQLGTVSYKQGCKIGQLGNVFFAAAGPFAGPGLDIRSVFVEAQATGGTIQQIASRFADHWAMALAKTLQKVKTSSLSQFQKLTSEPINVYFFTFDGDIPLVLMKRIFFDSFAPNNATNIQIQEYDCPPGCNDVFVGGIGHMDAMDNLSSALLGKQSPAELINERIKLSIKGDPMQSGPPIVILRLKKNSAGLGSDQGNFLIWQCKLA